MKRIITLTLCVLITCVHARAQNEFFVSVDPSDGSFKKINIFPDVNWIDPKLNTYSQSLHRFYFCGGADIEKWQFYTVDAHTGKVINQCPLPENDPYLRNVSGVAFNDGDQKIYALYYNSQQQTFKFVSIDPQNLTYKTVCDLPGLIARGMYAEIDQKHNRYLCLAYDDNGGHSYVIDIATGTILSANQKPAISMDFMKFDNDRGLLYGLALNINGSQHTIVSFDPVTCAYSVIRPMPEMGSCYAGAGFFAYDEPGKNYFYLAQNADGKPMLVSVNTTDGTLQHTPQYFPHVKSNGDNIICWQYDHSLNKFFALHWEPARRGQTRVIPNPIITSATAYVDTIYASVSYALFTTDGKKVQEDEVANTNNIPIKRRTLASGMYFLNLYGDGKYIGTEKVIVE